MSTRFLQLWRPWRPLWPAPLQRYRLEKRANYFLCCLSFQPKHGGEVISNKANLKKSTVGVADVVHRHRRRWEGGGVGGRWGWRPPPACRGDDDDDDDDVDEGDGDDGDD